MSDNSIRGKSRDSSISPEQHGWHPSAFNRAPVVEIMEKEEGGETKETIGKQGCREG